MFNISSHNDIELVQGETINLIVKTNDYKFINTDEVILIISDGEMCIFKYSSKMFEGSKCFINIPSDVTLDFPIGDYNYSLIAYYDNDQVSYLITGNNFKIKEGFKCLN